MIIDLFNFHLRENLYKMMRIRKFTHFCIISNKNIVLGVGIFSLFTSWKATPLILWMNSPPPIKYKLCRTIFVYSRQIHVFRDRKTCIKLYLQFGCDLTVFSRPLTLPQKFQTLPSQPCTHQCPMSNSRYLPNDKKWKEKLTLMFVSEQR